MIDTTKMRLQGHVLIAQAKTPWLACDWALSQKFTQFSLVILKDSTVEISVPLDKVERDRYTWLYHKMEGLRNQDPEPPKGGPKPPKGPTPPSGGSPAAGKTVAATEVNAIAA